jgi:hypothetical protein
MRLVAFGDSVVWGQGLLPAHKFTTLVYEHLNGGPPANPDDFQLIGHSGATIGAATTNVSPRLDGEVPDSYPTILRQVADFADPPSAFDLVIVNGGINDVGAFKIVNPLTDLQDLRDATDQYCRQDMQTLLAQVATKFADRRTGFVVPSYFPILSKASDPARVPDLLGTLGLDINRLTLQVGNIVFGKIYRQCRTFFEDSNVALKAAVDAVNAGPGANRIRFAPVPFTDQNSVFAPEAWLWGVGQGSDPTAPQDEVIGPRHASCDQDEADPIRREICYRASACHPNVVGAAQFASAILSVAG